MDIRDDFFHSFFSIKYGPQAIGIASSQPAIFLYSELAFGLERFCETFWHLYIREWNRFMCGVSIDVAEHDPLCKQTLF